MGGRTIDCCEGCGDDCLGHFCWRCCVAWDGFTTAEQALVNDGWPILLGLSIRWFVRRAEVEAMREIVLDALDDSEGVLVDDYVAATRCLRLLAAMAMEVPMTTTEQVIASLEADVKNLTAIGHKLLADRIGFAVSHLHELSRRQSTCQDCGAARAEGRVEGLLAAAEVAVRYSKELLAEEDNLLDLADDILALMETGK